VSRFGTTRRRATGTRGRRHPSAKDARAAVAEHVATARDKVTPGLEHAREALAPTVEHVREAAAPQLATAKEKLVEDVLPRVGASVAAALAASEPMREEAKRRGTATVAALKGEVEPPPPPRRRRRVGRRAGRVLFLTGLSAAVAAAVKAWRDSKQRDQWTSSDMYAPTPATSPPSTVGSAVPPPAGVTPAAPGATAAPADAAGASPDEALADEARARVTDPGTDTIGPTTRTATVSEQEIDDAIREASAKSRP